MLFYLNLSFRFLLWAETVFKLGYEAYGFSSLELLPLFLFTEKNSCTEFNCLVELKKSSFIHTMNGDQDKYSAPFALCSRCSILMCHEVILALQRKEVFGELCEYIRDH